MSDPQSDNSAVMKNQVTTDNTATDASDNAAPSEIPPFDIDLDVTGLVCPLPVLRTRKRMKTMESGQRIRVRATDPASSIDIRHFADTSGHSLVFTARDDGVYTYILQCGDPTAE